MSHRLGWLWAVSCVVLIGCGNGGPHQSLDAGALVDAGHAPTDAALVQPDAALVDAGTHDAGRDAGDGSCQSRDECGGGSLCFGPDEPFCGAHPLEDCDSDEQCPDGVCHAIFDGCSADGIGSTCGAACTSESCGDGFTCTDGGHCRPTACGDAFMCRASEECDPSSIEAAGPVHAITHGCVAIACTNDDPCSGASRCVNGRCQSGLGHCAPPPP
jgi:hypothetical protein